MASSYRWVFFFKVNWDVDVDKCNKKIGIGVIVRDSMGEVLATPSAPKDYIIMTALRAAIFSRELEMQKVEQEGDSL